jgi:hypothetical protein
MDRAASFRLLVGASTFGAATVALVWSIIGTRRSRLGMVAPATAKTPYAMNPWTVEADKKRLASYFTDVRAKRVQDVVPRGLPLPDHIKPFAEYMVRRSKKPLTNRDIVKAYLMTVGSMQRSAISPQKVEEYWPAFEQTRPGKIRPEDVLGQLLRTSAGQRYLDAAAQGRLDRQAATAVAGAFDAFGLGNRFRAQLAKAPELARQGDTIRRKLRGNRAGWYKFIGDGNMPGIKLSKAGFIAALLGRGDITTADARQVNFWTCPRGAWDSKKLLCTFPAIGRSVKGQWRPGQFDRLESLVDANYIEQLNKQMRGLKVSMPARYQPFYEHLTHHTFWDRIGGTKTTHQEIIEAMELAG